MEFRRIFCGRLLEITTVLSHPDRPADFNFRKISRSGKGTYTFQGARLKFRHNTCNYSITPGSKRWPALATWIIRKAFRPTVLVGRPFLLREARPLNLVRADLRGKCEVSVSLARGCVPLVATRRLLRYRRWAYNFLTAEAAVARPQERWRLSA